MFMAALFKIAKTRKQPTCPLTDEWIKKMWCTHTMEYYSATKRNEIVPFAEMWMDLETVLQDAVNQKVKNKYHILTHICGIQKNHIEESVGKAQIETDIENKCTDTNREKG